MGLKASEAVGPFQLSTYQSRRKNLAAKLSKRLATGEKDFVALVWSGSELIRNQDAHYDFRANSDFLYLTGFSEPDSLLVLIKTSSSLRSIIFLRDRDLSPERGSEIWEGERVGVKRAPKWLGVDEALPIEKLEELLPRILRLHRNLFWRTGEYAQWDQKILSWIRNLRNLRTPHEGLAALFDYGPDLHALRKLKSKEEIEWMRKSAWIAAQGHIRAMRMIQEGQKEFEVQAEAEREFKRLGAECPSYSSICASAERACILHYRNNNQVIPKGALMLMDAGAELRGYASDITRSFPASGVFSPAQAEVYNWVLRAQLAAIQAVKPGVMWNQPHQAAIKVIAKALLALGVIRGKSESEIVKKNLWRAYMPHGTSHWIGLDVHDVGAYEDEKGKPVKLEVGNVLTIEPGLYFQKNDKRVPARLRGIGIRIEDDVAVTSRGRDVLSSACPKTIQELEALRKPRM